MENKKEKVVHISKDIRGAKTPAEEAQELSEESAASISPERGRRDVGKAAVFISILAVLLLVVFFYALNRNIAGLASQVEELSALRTQVTQMDQSIGAIQGDVSGIQGEISSMQEKMAILDEVPDITRRTMLRSMLQDLSQRVAFIAEETETPEQAAKIKAAQILLNEAQADMVK